MKLHSLLALALVSANAKEIFMDQGTDFAATAMTKSTETTADKTDVAVALKKK